MTARCGLMLLILAVAVSAEALIAERPAPDAGSQVDPDTLEGLRALGYAD